MPVWIGCALWKRSVLRWIHSPDSGVLTINPKYVIDFPNIAIFLKKILRNILWSGSYLIDRTIKLTDTVVEKSHMIIERVASWASFTIHQMINISKPFSPYLKYTYLICLLRLINAFHICEFANAFQVWKILTHFSLLLLLIESSSNIRFLSLSYTLFFLILLISSFSLNS